MPAARQSVTSDLAEGFGLDRPGGVVVTRVYPGGPADRAGLRKGDVITGLDGQPIEDLAALRYRLATRPLNGAVPIDVWRDRSALMAKLPLEAAPERPPRNETELTGRTPLRGATVANLSPALAEELELEAVWEGLIITAIARGSTAARLGFRPGDLLVAINGEEIRSVDGLRTILAQQRRRWAISFSRGGRVRTVEIS